MEKYEIVGNIVPYVELTLNEGEEVYTQSGGMSWRDTTFEMSTSTKGGIMKGLGRMFSGESMFMNTYRSLKDGSKIAFSSTAPGEIIPINLSGSNGIIAQKNAFLCGEDSVKCDITFTKKFGAGLFGGEGFVLQDIHGEGMAFLEVDGNITKKELKEGEAILVDTGSVVYFDKTCKYEIEMVKGAKNILLGGEGLFLTKIVGPGNVVLQSQNFNEFVGRISSYLPKSK